MREEDVGMPWTASRYILGTLADNRLCRGFNGVLGRMALGSATLYNKGQRRMECAKTFNSGLSQIGTTEEADKIEQVGAWQRWNDD